MAQSVTIHSHIGCSVSMMGYVLIKATIASRVRYRARNAVPVMKYCVVCFDIGAYIVGNITLLKVRD